MRPLLSLIVLLLVAPAGAAQLELPVQGPASSPRLTESPDGTVLLSWMEPVNKRVQALRYARLGADGTWSKPVTVHRGPTWFQTWADAPTVSQNGAGWVALWLVPAAKEGHGSHLVFSTSQDGAKWSRPAVLHDDRSDTEHGFASVLPGPSRVDAAWLDGRGYAGESKQTALMARQIADPLGPERVLDERTCDCCPTAATPDGSVLAWRDRIGGEIRDISIAAREEGYAGRRVTHDDWEFAGCPVNGPAIANNQGDLLAWYTADGTPSVQAVLLGEGWPRDPVRVAEGAGLLGRVGAAAWGDGWLVSFVQETADGRAELRGRSVSLSGELGDVQVLGELPAARSAGFPSIAQLGEDLVIVWQDGDPTSLRGIRLERSE